MTDVREKLIEALSAYDLRVQCPTCFKWTASYFNYEGYAFRCAGCRKKVGDCHCSRRAPLETEEWTGCVETKEDCRDPYCEAVHKK